MKGFLIIFGLVATSLAQNCDNTFGAFLNALNKNLNADDGTAKSMETEFRDEYYNLVRKCFASSSSDSSKCALADDELKGDIYGDNGPLRGAPQFQKLAKGLRDKYLKSQESVRQCFRKHLAQAIREELEPCIQGKISNGINFHVPEIPDFDQKTFQNIDIAEQAVNYRIVARSRLEVCKQVNPAKYANTQPCMDQGANYVKHCKAASAAKTTAVPSSCSSRFNEVEQATCQCMNEKRDEWHQKFDKIQNIVNTATSGTQCGNDIANVVGAWLGKLQSAISECMPSGDNKQQTDLRTMIGLGCQQVIAKNVKQNELTTGFRFVRLFLDALNDRLTVFCGKNCSF